jgi:hypothetical protein
MPIHIARALNVNAVNRIPDRRLKEPPLNILTSIKDAYCDLSLRL